MAVIGWGDDRMVAAALTAVIGQGDMDGANRMVRPSDEVAIERDSSDDGDRMGRHGWWRLDSGGDRTMW